MTLTRDFKETVKARAVRDPEFRKALVNEAVECLLANDFDTAKSILRDYINATIGFEALAAEVGTPPKSLMRMFGPRAIHKRNRCSRSLRTSANGRIWRPDSRRRNLQDATRRLVPHDFDRFARSTSNSGTSIHDPKQPATGCRF